MKAKITPVSPGSWRLDVVVKKDGKQYRKRLVVNGTKKEAELRYWEIRKQLADDSVAAESSLTSTISEYLFHDVLELYLSRGPSTITKSYIQRLDRELGHLRIEELTLRFPAWIHALKGSIRSQTGRPLSPAAINRFIAWATAALNFAVRSGVIADNPVKYVRREPEEARDRVLSVEETQRLLAVLLEMKSFLYWPVRFALKNPIRRGDLFSLTRDNLDLTKPWIHFRPQKTSRKKKRETCLVCIDDDLLAYFQQLPAACPYLFPKLTERGSWEQVGRFDKHWTTVMRRANISGFTVHDLKHCALTYMLDQGGFGDRDIKNLGIQYSPAMIDRYYNADAQKALGKWRGKAVDGVEEPAEIPKVA